MASPKPQYKSAIGTAVQGRPGVKGGRAVVTKVQARPFGKAAPARRAPGDGIRANVKAGPRTTVKGQVGRGPVPKPPTALARYGAAAARGAGAMSKPSKQAAGSVNAGRFAGQVGRNFGKGVAAVGQGIGQAAGAAGRTINSISSGFGSNQISDAMRIPDSQNPLKKILK